MAGWTRGPRVGKCGSTDGWWHRATGIARRLGHDDRPACAAQPLLLGGEFTACASFTRHTFCQAVLQAGPPGPAQIITPVRAALHQAPCSRSRRRGRSRCAPQRVDKGVTKRRGCPCACADALPQARYAACATGARCGELGCAGNAYRAGAEPLALRRLHRLPAAATRASRRAAVATCADAWKTITPVQVRLRAQPQRTRSGRRRDLTTSLPRFPR